MTNVLMCLLGLVLVLVVAIILLVLGLNVRVQQLRNEKYSDADRFKFVSWVISWASPLIFNMRVEASGIEKLEAVETGVIYANHQSNMDIVTLLKAVNKPHGYISKKELDHIFLLSDAMRLIHCEFMDRNDVRQSVKVISSAAKTVKEGHLMVIFPEGTREVNAPMGTFKAGSFKLAQKAKADIIPITIENSHEVAKRWPRKTVIKMHVHDVVKYSEYEALSTNEICEKVETIIKG
ncbi:MAG TPA: 1-acyl-sn-glycerol-3-phosphate acyltransferase [Firmicutes bacterium]|nr:1-acyl-sn-glycerol-3-phosphate acyltransferase [Bacillota bacterium]